MDFNEPNLPKTLTQMQMGVRFIENCNYMISAQVMVLIVGLVIFLMSRGIKSYSSQLLTASKYVLNEVFLVLVLFNSVGVGFSLGLHVLYWSRPYAQSITNQIINLAPAATVLAMAGIHFWIMHKHKDFFEHNNQMFKQEKSARYFPMIMFCTRLVIGATLAGLSEMQFGIAVPAAFEVGYLVYVLVKRPYKKTVVSIRGIFNECVIAVIFGVTILYNFDVMNAKAMSDSAWAVYLTIPAWLGVAFVCASMLFNLSCEIYAVYKFTCYKRTAKVNPSEPPKEASETKTVNARNATK